VIRADTVISTILDIEVEVSWDCNAIDLKDLNLFQKTSK